MCSKTSNHKPQKKKKKIGTEMEDGENLLYLMAITKLNLLRLLNPFAIILVTGLGFYNIILFYVRKKQNLSEIAIYRIGVCDCEMNAQHLLISLNPF